MAGEQLLVAGRLRCQAGLRPQLAQEVDPGPEPPRRQRVAGPEVVRQRARAEDEQREVGHEPTIAAMERTYTTPLLDKLGVRPGSRVAIVGDVDPDGWFRALVADRTSDVTIGEPAPDTDLVFLAADSTAELAALSDFRRRIRPNGAIWVVSRKGKAATIRDVEVMAAAREAGLVDNKVASFSDSHTSIRLVIPVADRPRA